MSILWIAGIACELAIFGFVVYRRTWRTLPFFCFFMVWILCCDTGNYFVMRHLNTSFYLRLYLIESLIDLMMQLAVLTELVWSVLRPFRSLLPRFTWVVIGLAMLAAAAAIWPLGAISALSGLYPEGRLLVQLQQTESILRVVFFLLLAASSQLLAIGWRDRELQVATGLGFYSLLSLAVSILQMRQTHWGQYNNFQELAAAGYLLSLLYWVLCFARKEPARKPLTPQMERILRALAGSAPSQRIP